MALLHFLEVQNFKRFGTTQRIPLDHPAVLIGPNNCGKTTALQAIALWSQAIKTWWDVKGEAPPKERTATSLNRLNIVAVPVRKTRYLWHNTATRRANADIPIVITVGVLHDGKVERVTMRFRNQGDELVYCTPDDETLARLDLIEAAARLNIALLYPMSGLETDEPILQPGFIDVLMGQGRTAQVLRNLCLQVFKADAANWMRVTSLMRRLFSVDLDPPSETSRGTVDLFYRQEHVREPLDVAQAGRGFQQMLLIFAYLQYHRRSILLVDEPDAHLELLRQKQVYMLLRELATTNGSQVVLVTHSEVILGEALEQNLTLFLGGEADDLAKKTEIKNALKHYGAEHYLRARQRGYVLYVEGSTDIAILRAMASHLQHRAAEVWDERVNVFYVQDNYPAARDMDSELERVEGGFGVTPRDHFFALRALVPGLLGLAILDNDGRGRTDDDEDRLRTRYWTRYEAENYFVSPEALLEFVKDAYQEVPLFGQYEDEARDVLEDLLVERVFRGVDADFRTWQAADAAARTLIWEARTERLKLSDFAEEFFRLLAGRLGHAMLLRKGELYRLLAFVDPAVIPSEVSDKLDLLAELFSSATPPEGA